MKKTIIGVFERRNDAEKAINRLHNELSIPNEEISYLYRNDEDEVRAGNILISAHAEDGAEAESILRDCNALYVDIYTLKV